MSTILGILGMIIVDGFFGILFTAIVVALFFIWLNRGNAKVDEKMYDQNFDPGKSLAANVFTGKEKEPDPEVALKAYSLPIGGGSDGKDRKKD